MPYGILYDRLHCLLYAVSTGTRDETALSQFSLERGSHGNSDPQTGTERPHTGRQGGEGEEEEGGRGRREELRDEAMAGPVVVNPNDTLTGLSLPGEHLNLLM